MAHIFDNIKSYQEELIKHNKGCAGVIDLDSNEKIQLGDGLFITGICLDGYFVVVTYEFLGGYTKKVRMHMAMDVLSSDIINQISFALRKRV